MKQSEINYKKRTKKNKMNNLKKEKKRNMKRMEERYIEKKRFWENREKKYYERIQNRENKNGDFIDLVLFFKETLTKKEEMVAGLNLNETKNAKLED